MDIGSFVPVNVAQVEGITDETNFLHIGKISASLDYFIKHLYPVHIIIDWLMRQELSGQARFRLVHY